jgi:SAM-dependent methyltransferase
MNESEKLDVYISEFKKNVVRQAEIISIVNRIAGSFLRSSVDDLEVKFKLQDFFSLVSEREFVQPDTVETIAEIQRQKTMAEKRFPSSCSSPPQDSSQSSREVRYQDYVIRDGKLVGDFEGLYRDCADPWHQSRSDHTKDSRRALAVNWCQRLRSEHHSARVMELGCGFGHLSKALQDLSFNAVGVDISRTAIEQARQLNPNTTFVEGALSDFDFLRRFDPDIFLMAEITWYILDDLDLFLRNLRQHSSQRTRPTFLIHLLTTYAAGVQKYGVDHFTSLDEILKYFDLNYVESGFIRTPREDDPNSQGTYFIARV